MCVARATLTFAHNRVRCFIYDSVCSVVMHFAMSSLVSDFLLERWWFDIIVLAV